MSEAFGKFEEACVRPQFNEMLQRMEQAFQQEKKQFRSQFILDFQKACCCQNVYDPEMECAYLTVEFLRTGFCKRDYGCRMVFYDSDWYFGRGNPVGRADLSVIYRFYHQLENELKEEAKRYVGQITSLEVDDLMISFLPVFQEYAKELIGYAIGEAVEQEEFLSLKKGKELQIRVGECLEPGELIFLEKKEKDRDKLLEWLQENQEEAYSYQDFRKGALERRI